MWRALIICIWITILVIVLRTDFAQYFLQDLQKTTSGWITDLMSVPEQHQLSQLREGFFYNNLRLQPHQTDYVFEITQSKDKLQHFYQRYCNDKDKNPFLYGTNLTRLCSQIQSADIL